MPFTEDDPKLPDRIKRLPAATRRQWSRVWNSVFEGCQARGGEDCEGAAFRQANGVIAKGKFDEIDFTPPKGVREAARRGLKLRRKFGRGGLSTQEAAAQGIGSGVQRATNLANGNNVSPETIRRMVSFFARHENNKNSRTESGEPGAGMIAWLLWGGNPGQRWANRIKRQMDQAEGKVKKMITVDGLAISLDDLMSALKQPSGGQREMLREAQRKRAEKFGINIQAGAPLTIPAQFARLGAKVEDFGDPVNLRYPVWLTKPDRESLTPAQLKQVRNAPARLAQFSDRYDPASRAAVERRIDEARKKFEIGEFAETEKNWECTFLKADEEKQVALGVALKASDAANGLRPDTQRDTLTSEEVEKAAYGFMIDSRMFDLHHKAKIPNSRAAVVESYLSPVNFKMGKTEVKTGDWVVGVKFFDRALWEDVKAGRINAFSIKGVGRRSPMRRGP